jgi:hypothetical protein
VCGIVHRWPASGRWSSGGITRGVAMKGADLGFASVLTKFRHGDHLFIGVLGR